MAKQVNILLLEDNDDDAILVQRELERTALHCRVKHVKNRDEFESALHSYSPDLILADYNLPEYNGLTALHFVQERFLKTPFIFVSGMLGEEAAIEALKSGATDYVLKNNLKRLTQAVIRAISEAENQNKRELAEETLRAKTEELELSEKRFRLTLEAAQIGTWDWDIINDIWYASPVYYTMSGYKPKTETADRQEWIKRLHPNDVKEVTEKIRTVLNHTVNSYEYEARMRHADGSYRWQKVIGFGVEWDTNGKVTRMLGIRIDIDEQKRMLNALQESEVKFNTAFYNSPSGIIILSAKNHICIDVNDILLNRIGYKKEEIVGHPFNSRNIWENKGQQHEFLNILHQNGSVRDIEISYRCKNNETRFALLSALLMTINGETCILAHVIDIHDRKLAELALYAREEEFRVLAENSPDGIFRYDTNGNRIYVNPAVERFTGISATVLLGNAPDNRKILSGYFAITHNNAVRQVIETAKPTETEGEYKAKDGRSYFFESRFAPELDVDCKVKSVLCITRDITGQKHIENVLHFIAQKGWAATTDDFFSSLVSYVGRLLNVDYVFIDIIDEGQECAETIALYAKGSIVPNFKYPLSGTPCENVIGKNLCCYNKNVRALFPNDALLAEMNIESYSGIPLWDSAGNPAGLIAIMDSKPFNNETTVMNLLQVITPRVAAELEREHSNRLLKESEIKFRSLAENLPDNVIRYDKNCRVIYINPNLERHLNTSFDKIKFLTPKEIQPGRFDEYEEQLRKVIETGEEFEMELYTPVPGSPPLCYLISMTPECDENGLITGVLATGRNITELKRVEEERINNLRFFENMDKINTVIRQSTDLEQMMHDAMEQVLSIFGCDRAYLLYPCDPAADSWHVPMECTTPEYPGVFQSGRSVPMNDEMAAYFNKLLQSETPFTFDIDTANTSMKEFFEQFGVKSTITMAIYPKTGKPWKFGIQQCSYIRHWKPEDVKLIKETGRRLTDALTGLLAYRDLKISEERLRHTLDATGTVTWEIDLSTGRHYECGPVAGLFGHPYGYAHNSVDDFIKAVHPDDRQDVTEKFNTALKKGTLYNAEFRVLLPDGNIRWIGAKGNPVKDNTGNPAKLLGIAQDITERKQDAQQIEMLSFALNNASEGIFISEENSYNYLYVNDSACRMLGYTHDELLGLSPFDFILDLDMDVLTKLSDTIDQSRFVVFESLHKTKDGTILPVEVAVSMFRYGNKKFVLAVTRDITERKRHLREIEMLSIALNNAADGIFIGDKFQANFTYVNDSACRSLGYTHEELLKLTVFDIDPLFSREEYRKRFPDGRDIKFESQHKTKDGRVFPVEITQSQFKHGEIVYLMSNVRDITERKQITQQVEMLGFALDNASEGVFINEAESFNYLYINDSACRSLGYSHEEMMKLTTYDFDPDLTPDMIIGFKESVSSGKTHVFERRHKTKDGRIFPVEVTITPYQYHDKKYILAVSRDITGRKQAEAALRQSEERYRTVFEHSPVSIWEEDYSGILRFFDTLRKQGVEDLKGFLGNNPQIIQECADLIRILDINKAALHLFKATDKNELLNNLAKTFTPESNISFIQELVNIWNGKTHLTHDGIIQTFKGEKRFVTFYISLLPPKEGQTKAIVSLVDVTEQKQFEREIIKSEYHKTVLNQIANVFLTTPGDRMYEGILSIILEKLKSTYGMFGYIDENTNLVVPSLTKDIWSECQVPDKSIVFPSSTWGTSKWGKAITEQKTYISNGSFHTPKGHVPIKNNIAVPVIYGNKTIGLVSVANKKTGYTVDDKEILEEIAKFISPIMEARLHRDRLEEIRVLAENELRLSEERFSAAFNLNPLSMCIIRTSNKKIVAVNDTFTSNSGFNREEALNHTVTDLNFYVNPKDRDIILQKLDKEGKIIDYEYKTRRKSGEIRTQLLTSIIINFGEEPHILATFRDITEKKQLEQKIFSTTIETEEKERQRFAQELHDGIGPLLSSVKMLIQWILMPDSKANAQKILEKVLTIINEAHQTIREISFNLSPHILQNFGLIDALNIYSDKIRESSTIAIVIHSDNYRSRDIQVETVLYRALTECITNTLRHASAGKIHILINEDREKLKIIYSDNGKGFILAKNKQSGLGLQNMQNRLNSLNGQIKVESKPGKGTRIYFEI